MNIAIIDNNSLYRESLKTALNQIDGFTVSFDTADIHSFFQISNEYDFQIILLDFCYYQTDSIKKILRLLPDIKIIVLSKYNDPCFFDNHIDNEIDFISKCSNKFLFEQKIRKSLKNNSMNKLQIN